MSSKRALKIKGMFILVDSKKVTVEDGKVANVAPLYDAK